MTQYKKFVSEMKQFHHDKFASFKFGQDRLDDFFYNILNTQKTHEDLWTTVKFLLILSHKHAAVERGFSVNKEALAPILKEDTLKAVHLVHVKGFMIYVPLVQCVINNSCSID